MLPWDTEYKMIQAKKWNMVCSAVGEKRSTLTSILSLQQISRPLFGEKKCLYLPQNFMERKFTQFEWVRQLSLHASGPDRESSDGKVSHHAVCLLLKAPSSNACAGNDFPALLLPQQDWSSHPVTAVTLELPPHRMFSEGDHSQNGIEAMKCQQKGQSCTFQTDCC